MTGDRGVVIAMSKLPDTWVVRQITPDYGLDLHIEVFEPTPEDPDSADTLGEHFFAQVKTVAAVGTKTLQIGNRQNVMRSRRASPEVESADIEVATLSLETSELRTVEAMGPGVPVLLLLVDLSSDEVYYLCLNDYISKVLLPKSWNYDERGSSTLHTPLSNRLRRDDPASGTYIRMLARRAKLYTLFALLHYQYHEVARAAEGARIDLDRWTEEGRLPEDLLHMLEVFLRGVLRSDVWAPTGVGFWQPLRQVQHDFAGLLSRLEDLRRPMPVETADLTLMQLAMLFERAANISNIFEELVREWSLPTYLSVSISRLEAAELQAIADAASGGSGY